MLHLNESKLETLIKENKLDTLKEYFTPLFPGLKTPNGRDTDTEHLILRGMNFAVEAGNLPILSYLLESKVPPFRYLVVKTVELGNLDALELLINAGASMEYALSEARKRSSTRKFIPTLLDYSFGVDIPKHLSQEIFHNLKLDITGMKWLGVSENGKPLTRERLQALGCKNTDKAIVTLNDLMNVEPSRRAFLEKKLHAAIEKHGYLVDKNGLVNLVPLANTDDIEVIKTRLTAGADPNQVNERNQLIIVDAVKKGQEEKVRLLAEHRAIDPKSLLAAFAASKKRPDSYRYGYLSVKQPIDLMDDSGNTLLHYAAERHDCAEMATLLARGASPNLLNNKEETPLVLAVSAHGKNKEGKLNAIQLLLANGADPLCQGASALTKAVEWGSVAVIEKVLTAVKASENPAEHTWLLFRVAAAHHSFEKKLRIFQAFQKTGTTFTKPRGNETLLHLIVKLAPSDLRRADYVSLIQFLVDNGVDVTAPDGKGMPALYHFLKEIHTGSKIQDYEKILTLLVPADINLQNKNGETALHIAAEIGNQEVAAWLIARGAKIDILNNSKQTAFDIFKKEGNQEGVYKLFNPTTLPQPPASALPAPPASTSSHKHHTARR